MNEIQSARDEIEKYFDEKLLLPDQHEHSNSTSRRYQVSVDVYEQSKPDVNWRICQVVVTETVARQELLRVKCEDDWFRHCWIEGQTTDYLLFSETLGGQSVFDLRNRKLASYYNSDEPFIWAQFYPSPDLQKLAVIGCYWACPFEIVTYDFSTPLELPLPERHRTILQNNDDFGGWTNNAQFQLRNGDETRFITIE